MHAHSHLRNTPESKILSSQGAYSSLTLVTPASGPHGRFPGRTAGLAPPKALTSFTATNSLTPQPPPPSFQLQILSQCSLPQTHLHPPQGKPQAKSHPHFHLGLPGPSPPSTRPWRSLGLEPISQQDLVFLLNHFSRTTLPYDHCSG